MTAPDKSIRFPLENTDDRYVDFKVPVDEIGELTTGETLILNELRKGVNVNNDTVDYSHRSIFGATDGVVVTNSNRVLAVGSRSTEDDEGHKTYSFDETLDSSTTVANYSSCAVINPGDDLIDQDLILSYSISVAMETSNNSLQYIKPIAARRILTLDERTFTDPAQTTIQDQNRINTFYPGEGSPIGVSEFLFIFGGNE